MDLTLTTTWFSVRQLVCSRGVKMSCHKLLLSELKMWTSGRSGWISRLHYGEKSENTLPMLYLLLNMEPKYVHCCVPVWREHVPNPIQNCVHFLVKLFVGKAT